ncbi:MAG: hypothetical protein F6K39_03390 [Okeania sp. SIO3B3]|nr:hypothetical protein [Okeania sp. SIO3B3]
MSGAPVVDVKGKVVAVHGMIEEEEREGFAFSRGVPINLFHKYRRGAIALAIEKQEEKLQRQLEEVRRKFQESERRVQELETELEAKQKKVPELQKQLEEERRKREDTKRQKQQLKTEKQEQVENEIPLVSAQAIDYTKLRDLLAAGKWEEADLETDRVMLKVAGRKSEGWLRYEDVENFSCQDLSTIDKLWVRHSNGKFGFSVQKQIYQSLGSRKDYDNIVWRAFGDKVGWRKESEWLRYGSLTFSDKHYKGHLPGWVWWRIGSVTSSLVLRLERCNI